MSVGMCVRASACVRVCLARLAQRPLNECNPSLTLAPPQFVTLNQDIGDQWWQNEGKGDEEDEGGGVGGGGPLGRQ